jgi:predicted kinase
LFSERLAAGTLLADQVEALGRRIGEFHLAAPSVPAGSDHGTPGTIEAVMANLMSALPSQLDGSALATLRQWLPMQAEALRPVWTARREAGHVRECHGDLHLANATVFEGEALAFDCIEFDPALRWIDVMNDAAFMVMDLVAHKRRDLAFRFLDAWLELTGDHEGLRVLRFYMVYRALVRAWVAALRGQDSEAMGKAPDYLATALSIASSTDARLMITHGLSGSGKSFVSQQVLEYAGAVRLRSDVERKRLFGLRPLERSAAGQKDGIYTPQATRRTFETLRDRAAFSLDAGFPTIVDAAFLRRDERDMMAALAAERRVPFCILHCHASDEVLRHRIEARLAGGDDASEADGRVLRMQMEVQQDFADEERPRVIDVETSKDIPIQAICDRWATSVDA